MNKIETKIGIGIFVFDSSGKLLLLQRGSTLDKSGTWGLCGGRMDPDEDWETTASRELLEETGLDCHNFVQKGWVNYVDDFGQRWITLFVVANQWTGLPGNMEPLKCAGIGWFTFGRLPENLFEPLRKFIEQNNIVPETNRNKIDESDDLFDKSMSDINPFGQN